MEVSCQRREVGTGAYTYIGLVTGIPFLVAVAALTVTLLLHVRVTRLQGDELTVGRTALTVTVGILLNLLAIAAIVGDGIAIAVLEPC
jgi:hypothetical protein